MAKIKIKFAADGDSFEVKNMCANSSPGECVGEFKKLAGNLAEFSADDVTYTDEYYQQEELPPQIEEIES